MSYHNKRRRMYQDGGDAFDTSVFSEAIDELEGAGFTSEEEEVPFEVQEEETDITEDIIGSDFEIEEDLDERDIFDMMMDDDSFDLSASDRTFRDTNRYVRTETRRANIGQKQAERNQYAYNKYLSMGLSKVEAAAIVGNLAQESGIRALNYGDRDSKGVAQWRTDRYAGLNNWAKSQGKNPQDLDTQLEYVAVEARQRGDLQRIAGYTDVRQATIDFGRKYERPSEQHANWAGRADHAESVYRQSGGYGPSFKVPQPEAFTLKRAPDFNANNELIKQELIEMVGGQQLTKITPITSEPAYLTPKDNGQQTMSRLQGTGQWELPEEFQTFNLLARGTSFISNMLNAQRQRRKEQERIEEDSRKPVYDNFGISGISNIPNYNI